MSVQGKQLTPGQYTVEVNGEGPSVELSIANGKQRVASVPARLVTVSAKNRTSGYSSAKRQDGRSTLTSVFFQGKAYELQIGDQSATAAPGTTASSQRQQSASVRGDFRR